METLNCDVTDWREPFVQVFDSLGKLHLGQTGSVDFLTDGWPVDLGSWFGGVLLMRLGDL